ncbi:Pao retrotransposon peptidase [Ancylostoma ceylanicum]|uniref:Pao retrotransposon peptidase n=1 Tax=Ancylostoma ceylanicum TaxID=53326 RepID=A0A0D6LNB8_9BILA|nr:Pao retrotransposon peptidase [Ancylostoma ceylanicum]
MPTSRTNKNLLTRGLLALNEACQEAEKLLLDQSDDQNPSSKVQPLLAAHTNVQKLLTSIRSRWEQAIEHARSPTTKEEQTVVMNEYKTHWENQKGDTIIKKAETVLNNIESIKTKLSDLDVMNCNDSIPIEHQNNRDHGEPSRSSSRDSSRNEHQIRSVLAYSTKTRKNNIPRKRRGRKDSPHPRGRVTFRDQQHSSNNETSSTNIILDPFNPYPWDDTTDDEVNPSPTETLVCSSKPYTKNRTTRPRLMTVYARALNNKTKAQQLVSILLDTGSEHSYIREELAINLGLQRTTFEPLTVLTFGGQSVAEYSAKTQITLIDANDCPFDVSLSTRPKITSVHCTSRLPPIDCRYLGKHDVLFEPYPKTFNRMHMNLREFMSNNTKLMERIPDKDRSKANGTTKLLGIPWNPNTDRLHIRLKISSESVNSKRTVLKSLASTFDPMGLLTPLLVKAKIFLQDLWRKDYTWGKPLDDQDADQWRKIVSEIAPYTSSVSRFITDTSAETKYELLVFSDASQRVYAAVAYILCVSADKASKCNIVMAKSRLAPLKQVTIPRLELLGCYIAVKLSEFVRKESNIKFERTRYFSDSLIALHWIHSRKPLKVFVNNRVEYINRTVKNLAEQKIDVESPSIRNDT